MFFFVLFSKQVVVVSTGLDGVGQSGFSLGFFFKSSFEFFVGLLRRVLGSSELSNELFFLFDGSGLFTRFSLESSSGSVEFVQFSAHFFLLVFGLIELIF